MAEVRPRFFSAAHVAEMADVVVPAKRTNVPDNLAVNGARDAVLQLEVHLGNRVLGKHRSVRDITCRRGRLARADQRRGRAVRLRQSQALGRGARVHTDRCGLNHVADGKPLDGLILGRAARAVAAADRLHMAATCEEIGQQQIGRSKSRRGGWIDSHPSCCGRCSFSS